MSIVRPFHRFFLLAAAALIGQAVASAQDSADPASKTEAMQIGPLDRGSTEDKTARKVYLDERPAARPRPSVMQAEGDQVGSSGNGGMAPIQITAGAESARRMPQLSRAELDATLAQLTPAERRVLLQAIEGTDICDNPPAIAAIVTLCQTRIETRSSEFAPAAEAPLTAEERLIRSGTDNNGIPRVEAVISRLSRVTAASSDDLSNQAIASVALAPPPGTERPDSEEGEAGLGLGAETEALINAIVQQLGGSGSGGQP